MIDPEFMQDIIRICYERENPPSWISGIEIFEDLPRFGYDYSAKWIYLQVNSYTRLDTEETIWIVENTKHRWYSDQCHRFFFEDKEDAAYFKMVWG